VGWPFATTCWPLMNTAMTVASLRFTMRDNPPYCSGAWSRSAPEPG